MTSVNHDYVLLIMYYPVARYTKNSFSVVNLRHMYILTLRITYAFAQYGIVHSKYVLWNFLQALEKVPVLALERRSHSA